DRPLAAGIRGAGRQDQVDLEGIARSAAEEAAAVRLSRYAVPGSYAGIAGRVMRTSARISCSATSPPAPIERPASQETASRASMKIGDGASKKVQSSTLALTGDATMRGIEQTRHATRRFMAALPRPRRHHPARQTPCAQFRRMDADR